MIAAAQSIGLAVERGAARTAWTHAGDTTPRATRQSWTPTIGVGAQSTLGGTAFLPEKYVRKINKILEFYTILARKIIKIPEFL